MLAESIRNIRMNVLQLLLGSFPGTVISEPTVRAALANGSTAIFEQLLSYDPDLIKIDIFEGRSSQLGYPLSCRTSRDFIRLLLVLGVDPNPPPPGPHPLCLAAGRWQTESIELSRTLLEHGSLIKHSGALAAAAKSGNIDLVKFLLAEGAEVNDIISNPEVGHVWPALHTAIENGKEDITGLLLEHKANPDLFDENGRTAYMVAEATGNQRMLELLHRDSVAKLAQGNAPDEHNDVFLKEL